MSETPDIGQVMTGIPWARWILHGLSGGTAVVLGLAGIDAVRSRPEFLQQLVNGGFFYFAIIVVFLFVVDRRAQGFIELQTRNVVAQELLASNVGSLLTQKNERERETQLLLDELAENSRVIRKQLRRLTLKEFPGQEDIDGID